MIKNITKVFNITAVLVLGSLAVLSCESDADQLGSQFFQNGAQGNETTFPVIAYNANNNDSIRIRTDNLQTDSATLGAFAEPQFGMQKSAYVTQVRLSSYAPDFGTNPVLDSAVMLIKPSYSADSITTITKEDYIYPEGAVAAKSVVNRYPVKKYGKAKINGKTIFNIKVHEVNEFLFSRAEKFYSNKNVATSNLLGSKVFDGNISSVKLTKDSDNSVLYESDPSIRIHLDSLFFQNNIMKKASSAELADAATFIRYFKGMKISIEENDGYIFKFAPGALALRLYYKKDKTVSGTTTRETATFDLDLGANNVHFNQITFDRSGTPSQLALANVDKINGDPKIFAQGMGGPGIGLRVPKATVDLIKNMYKNEKIGITTAKLRIYTDKSTWENTYKKPESFVVNERIINTDNSYTNLYTFLTDMNTLANSGNYFLVKPYNLNSNPAYYDIGITQTFKNIIEADAANNDIILNVGSYSVDAKGTLIGLQYPDFGAQNFNNRYYTPNRAVFVGSDPTNEQQRAKLILTYGKK